MIRRWGSDDPQVGVRVHNRSWGSDDQMIRRWWSDDPQVGIRVDNRSWGQKIRRWGSDGSNDWQRTLQKLADTQCSISAVPPHSVRCSEVLKALASVRELPTEFTNVWFQRGE